jgi:hypothetical protein
MVGDVHRTLLYGGIFGYPADTKNKDGMQTLNPKPYTLAAPMSPLNPKPYQASCAFSTRLPPCHP